MAYQIETSGSEAAAVVARADPWHRLGTRVRDRLSRDAGRSPPELHCACANGLLQRLCSCQGAGAPGDAAAGPHQRKRCTCSMSSNLGSRM